MATYPKSPKEMTRGMLYFPRMLDKIRLHARGDLTINYLDTHGLPLTAEHLASAMALVAKIAGVSNDEDKQLAREAQIAKYLMLLYGDIFEQWNRDNSERLLDVARHACLLARLK